MVGLPNVPRNGNENAAGKSKSRGGWRPGFSVVKPLWYQELSQGYSVPFLHIGDCMVGELKEANLKPIETGSNVKIGLLGTEETLRVGFYQDRLSNQDKYRLSYIWANNPYVRKAIHAQSEEITGEWQRCTTRFKYIEEVQSVVEYHRNLTRKGYRALIFRYTRLYDNNLTFATVKGAGHTAPEYKPRQSFVMFKQWNPGERL